MSDSAGLYDYESPTTPPPEQEPPHDTPPFPEHDPPPGSETAVKFAGPGEQESPDEGEDDVDDDDLDPQVPHSPPDGKKGRIVFDENGKVG